MGYLPSRVAVKPHCWATACYPMAWAGGSPSLWVLLELLSASSAIFVQGFRCCSSNGIVNVSLFFFLTQVSCGKMSFIFLFLELKFATLLVCRGINLTKHAHFRFQNETEIEVCMVSVCLWKGVVLEVWCFQSDVKWGIKYKIQLVQLLSSNSWYPWFLPWHTGVWPVRIGTCVGFGVGFSVNPSTHSFAMIMKPRLLGFSWLGHCPWQWEQELPLFCPLWRVAGGATSSSLLKGLSSGVRGL